MKKAPSLRIGQTQFSARPQACETVNCPRKGPWGAEISLLVCDQLHSADESACARHSCTNAVFYQKSIRMLRLMQKRRSMSYTEAQRIVDAGEDLAIAAEEDLEDPEDSEEQE